MTYRATPSRSRRLALSLHERARSKHAKTARVATDAACLQMAPARKPSRKCQHVSAEADESYPTGATVAITGLTQQAGLNGMHVVVLDFKHGKHKVALTLTLTQPTPHPSPSPSPT